MKIKSSVHRLAHRTGLSAALAKSQSCCRVLMYHGVPRTESASFEAQIRYLKQHFDIVPLDEIITCLSQQRTARNAIALTFDDGLKNNYTVAYPILRKFGVPATFFVCPGLIETRSWLWTHEARARMQCLTACELTQFASTTGAPADIEGMVEWMKCMREDDRALVEAELRANTMNFRPSAEQRERYDLMNWGDLAELDQKLVTIGSHTMSHPILSSLREDACERELADSRKTLEAKLNRPVDLFCYPNGSQNPSVVECANKYYRAAVSTECNVITCEDSIMSLPRIPAAESIELLAWRLHRPGA